MEAMLADSTVRSGQVDFEKLMAESRISDISMQKTVIGVGMKRANSFVSQVESINEVDKLYTKEEMKITKIVGRIKETHTQMKMSWVYNEVDKERESSELDLKAGSALKKKNPSRLRTGSIFSRKRNHGKIIGNEQGTELEKEMTDYMKEKEEYEDFVNEFYNINKMTLDGTQNLMSFLTNPEADEELQDIEIPEENTIDGTELMITPNLTRKNSKIKIMSQFALNKSPKSKDLTNLDDITSDKSRNLKTSNEFNNILGQKKVEPKFNELKKLD